MSAGGDPMEGWVDAFPDLLRQAARAPVPSGFPLDPARITFLGGMGGSGMAGSVVALLLEERGVPAMARHGEEPPGWLDERDRGVVASYSGATWEAAAMVERLRARKVSIAVVASGGSLVDRCHAEGIPLFSIPPGFAPRAALPWLFVGVARATGACDDRWLEESIAVVERDRASLSAQRDPKRIADSLAGKIALIVPVGCRMGVVARRWRNQILENAEQASFVSPLPEMAHNEVMGWPFLRSVGAPVSIVVLDDRRDPRRIWEASIAALASEARRAGHPIQVVPSAVAEGSGGILADLLLADRVSVALARRRGVEPTPVEAIQRMREVLDTGEET